MKFCNRDGNDVGSELVEPDTNSIEPEVDAGIPILSETVADVVRRAEGSCSCTGF